MKLAIKIEAGGVHCLALHFELAAAAAAALVSLPTRRAIVVARDSKKSLNAVKYLDMELRP